MNNEGYDPRQDEDYQAFLRARQQEANQPPPRDEDAEIAASYKKMHPPPRAEGYYQKKPAPVRTFTPPVQSGKVWDKTKQEGEVFHVIQQGYNDKKSGLRISNGQVRIVVKEYEGNRFISIENWKPDNNDLTMDPKDQLHEIKRSCNLKVRELEEVGETLLRLAASLAGGEIR